MISLIAGKYKGKKLHQFNNINVRPTQAKIRKSIFQILEPFNNLEILDLYAGVGTLGLEAISRGASKAVFVEKDRQVFKILEKNIAQFHKEKLKLFLCDSLQFVSHDRNEKFDIIFADPPYIKTEYKKLKKKIQAFLKPNGIFCLEMQKYELDETPYRIKHYGNTQVVFWKGIA